MVNVWPAEAPYEDTDSEHEQPVWRLGSDRRRRQDEGESTGSSSSSSDGGTDDETNAERRRRFRSGSGLHARHSGRGARVSRGGPDISVVQADWNDAMASSAAPTGANDDRRKTYTTEATRGGAAPDKGEGNEHDPPALNSAPCTEPSSFEHRVARRAKRSGPDDMERGSGGMVTTASTK